MALTDPALHRQEVRSSSEAAFSNGYAAGDSRPKTQALMHNTEIWMNAFKVQLLCQRLPDEDGQVRGGKVVRGGIARVETSYVSERESDRVSARTRVLSVCQYESATVTAPRDGAAWTETAIRDSL